MHSSFLPQARILLCDLQNSIRDALLTARRRDVAQDFATVAYISAADTIYKIDKVSEDAILQWFSTHWPHDEPVELVMEGIDEIVTFPEGLTASQTHWKCILDPIDGTRNIMYDKRAAWSLAALAPQKGDANRLSDIVVAAMTELPTTKQWRADQISGVRGGGRDGLVCESFNVLNGEMSPLSVQPSGKTDFKHGFASFVHYFPEAKGLLAHFEEEFWDELYDLNSIGSPNIFDDQYISSGGQIYEILVGHDRMVGDLRPLALNKLGFETTLVCHPYDICTSFLLQEAGGLVEAPDGSPLDVPLDTTSPVSWMAYANSTLAQTVRPILKRLIEKHF